MVKHYFIVSTFILISFELICKTNFNTSFRLLDGGGRLRRVVMLRTPWLRGAPRSEKKKLNTIKLIIFYINVFMFKIQIQQRYCDMRLFWFVVSSKLNTIIIGIFQWKSLFSLMKTIKAISKTLQLFPGQYTANCHSFLERYYQKL